MITDIFLCDHKSSLFNSTILYVLFNQQPWYLFWLFLELWWVLKENVLVLLGIQMTNVTAEPMENVTRHPHLDVGPPWETLLDKKKPFH